MGYSNFRKIETFVEKFNFDVRFVALFSKPKKVRPSKWLLESLARASGGIWKYYPLTPATFYSQT